MARRYIKRINTDPSNAEWNHLSQLGPDLEFNDVMEVNQRYIATGKKLSKSSSQTMEEATKEGLRWALDAAGNAGQYIKYVNMTIEKRKGEIENIVKLQKKFDEQIEMLNSHKIKKLNTDKKYSKYDARTIVECLNQLLLEKRLTQSNLQDLHGELTSIEKEQKTQATQIEQVQKHIKSKILEEINNETQQTTLKAIKTIREELESLGQKYDISKLSGAVDTVFSSKNSK